MKTCANCGKPLLGKWAWTHKFCPVCEEEMPRNKRIIEGDELWNKIVGVLSCLHEDAEMALDDTWDRSDSGFVTQTELIDEIFDMMGVDYTPRDEREDKDA